MTDNLLTVDTPTFICTNSQRKHQPRLPVSWLAEAVETRPPVLSFPSPRTEACARDHPRFLRRRWCLEYSARTQRVAADLRPCRPIVFLLFSSMYLHPDLSLVRVVFRASLDFHDARCLIDFRLQRPTTMLCAWCGTWIGSLVLVRQSRSRAR